MCGGSPPRPPDVSGQADSLTQIAQSNELLAREQITRARQLDQQNRQLLSQVLDFQLPAMEEAFQIGRDNRQRYQEFFQPLEEQLVRDAQEFASPERQNLEASRAVQDVGQAFEAERANRMRELEGFGIDPSQTRAQALDVGMRTAQAGQAAWAGNQARRETEDRGRAMREQAINLGRGTLNEGTQATQMGGQMGAGALGAATGVAQAGQDLTGAAAGHYGAAMAGHQGSAGILDAHYQNQLRRHEASGGLGAALGGLAGMGVGYWVGGKEGATAGANIGGSVGGGMAAGGAVPDDIAPAPQPEDQFPTMLAKDEYVVPSEVVRAKGTEFFDRLVEKYAPERMAQREQHALPVGG